MAKKPARRTLILPDTVVAKIAKLREKMGAKDLIEVVKDAIRIYEALLDEVVKGSIFYIKRPGKETELFEVFTTPTTN